MRPETQKQIVKAFAMMYEDSDILLSDFIEKLQQLNGRQNKEEKRKKVWRAVTDKQILDAMKTSSPMKVGDINRNLPTKLCRESLGERLDKLEKKEKVLKTKIHPRLVHWTKL